MDCFIKKIFGKNSDKWVHLQFTKFSRGTFENKAMIRGKTSAGKYTLDTTYEYAKELIMNMAEKLGNEKTRVTGALISTLDLEGQFEYSERKMVMGVKKYIIDNEMTGTKILELCNNIDKAFFALSFKVGESELKIKPKSPKSTKGEGSSKKPDAKQKIDFCKLKTNDKELIKTLFLDDELSFKKIEIVHSFLINDLDIPKNEKDPAKMRENTIRKGKIIRKIKIDNDDKIKETEFNA